MSWHEDRDEESKEQKRLGKMSIEQLRTELDERIKASLIEEIQKLPERINNHLDDCVYKIITASLGIKKDNWHDSKWEIDTHNSKSAIAIELGVHVMEQVKLAIPDFIHSLVVGDPRIPPIKTAYVKAYKEHLAELINQKTWEVAHAHAEKRFVEIMAEITKKPVSKVSLDKNYVEGVDEDDDDDDEAAGAAEESVEEGTEGAEEEASEA